ncbi:MAG: glycosyltransferase [Chloroflexi bacterium]|nr:glycosyltransferase [Chloroflexota bacterium]
MPRFSLVIPTLRRADTLEHALATLLSQTEADVQIVVQNNGDDPATRELVERIADSRVQHFYTDETIPMAQNWEFALSNAKGDLVTFIGDDDGLLPDACRIAGAVFDDSDTEILAWEPFVYFWPSYWDERRRNRLHARVSFEFNVGAVASGPLLQRFFDFQTHYSKLPMIYNSFVSRSLLERVRDRHGRYFLGSLPDLTSGVVNAAFSKTFFKSERPLSVAGLSGHSTGHRLWRAETWASPAEFERDFPSLACRNPSQAPSLEESIGAEMALLEEEVVRERFAVTFNQRGLVRAMAAGINESPSRYEDTKSAILSLMKRLGMTGDEVFIPEPLDHPPGPSPGVHVLGPYEVLFVLEGDHIGLQSIADAVRLASQLVPPADSMVKSTAIRYPDGVPVVSTEPLSFARNADGALALASGWAEPEAWGAWSVERECRLRLRFSRLPESRLEVRLGLRYRTVPFPDGKPRFVECAIGERTLKRWELSSNEYRGELLITVPADDLHDALDLRLVNLNARSPKDMEIGEDQRPLGIGVEQIRIVP